MGWEVITNWLSQFFDKQIVVILSGVLTALVGAFVIFAKTSYGRKAIKTLLDISNGTRKIAQETHEKVKEVELLANEKIEQLKADYEKKTSALVSIVNYYEESLFSLIEKIPNAKVQNELTTLKYNYIAKKEEISALVGVTFQDFELEVEKRVEEAKKEIHEKETLLDERLLEIDELIKAYKEKLEGLDSQLEEVEYGKETEESENTDSDQEEV